MGKIEENDNRLLNEIILELENLLFWRRKSGTP